MELLIHNYSTPLLCKYFKHDKCVLSNKLHFLSAYGSQHREAVK